MLRPLPALCAALALLLVACGGDDDNSPTSPDSTAAVTVTSVSNGADACSPALPHDPGESRRTLRIGGIDRGYIVVVPDSYDGARATPVVLALHGVAGTAGAMRDITGIAPAASERGMIAVFPQGVGQLPAWNIEDFPGVDDTAFFEALIDDLGGAVCIDRGRVYVTGFSNGGGMAQKLACERPGLVAAIAPVAATYLPCTGKAPIIAFHGMRDAEAPFEGGATPGGRPLPLVRQLVSQWGRAVGCDAIAVISRPSAGVELSTYGNCPNGRDDALLYAIIEGVHTWPGGTTDPAGDAAIDATALILDFFEEHPSTPTANP